MPVAPKPADGSSNGSILYDPYVIRQVASKIIVNVSLAQDTHTNAWHSIQTYLNGDSSYFPASNGHVSTMGGPMPDVYYYLRTVLEPHVKRLQASFDLQLSLAQALFDLADQIEETDQKIKNSFLGTGTPLITTGKGHGFVP